MRLNFVTTAGKKWSAVLRGIDAQQQLTVPPALRPLLADAETWAGRSFNVRDLARALAESTTDSPLPQRGDPVTWDATDQERVDVDFSLPFLLLARDLLAMGLDGTLEVGGT